MILVNFYMEFARRLDPIEIYASDGRIRADRFRQIEGDLTNFLSVWADDAILHGPAHRRSELQRRDPRDKAGKILGEDFLKSAMKPVARGHILGDDHIKWIFRRMMASIKLLIFHKTHSQAKVAPDRQQTSPLMFRNV